MNTKETKQEEKLYYIGFNYQDNKYKTYLIKDTTNKLDEIDKSSFEISNSVKRLILMTLEEVKVEYANALKWFSLYKNDTFKDFKGIKYRRGSIFRKSKIFIGKAKKIKNKDYRIKVGKDEIRS